MSRDEVSTERLTQKPWPPPGGEQRRQHGAVIVVRERRLHEADAALVEQAAVLVRRIDHDEAVLVEGEVPLDQGQRAAPDGAEADHDDRAVDAAMHGPGCHLWSLLCGGTGSSTMPKFMLNFLESITFMRVDRVDQHAS